MSEPELTIEFDPYDFPQACELCGAAFVEGELIGLSNAGIVHAAHIDGSGDEPTKETK